MSGVQLMEDHMFKTLLRGFSAVSLMVVAGAAQAASTGPGTGIESGFAEAGADMLSLLNGAGGFLIVVVSIIIAAAMVAFGKGYGAAVAAFVVAMIMGYGVQGLQGIAGVTAGVELLADATHVIEADPTSSLVPVAHSQTSLL